MSARSVCKRQPPLQIPFFARDFRAVQPARYAHLDAFAAKSQRRIHCLAHRAPESHALFKLQRNRFGHERRVQFRAVHFLNIDVHFPLCPLLHFGLELVDFRAFAADDDAGTRCVNSHDKLVGGALDVNRVDTSRLELLLQHLRSCHVLMQKVGVVLLRKPARLPAFVVAEPKSVRMCFLPQTSLLLLFLLVVALRVSREPCELSARRPSRPSMPAASAAAAAARSAAAR